MNTLKLIPSVADFEHFKIYKRAVEVDMGEPVGMSIWWGEMQRLKEQIILDSTTQS